MVIILSLGIARPLIAAMNFVDTLATMGTTVVAVDEVLLAKEQEHGEQAVQLNGTDIELHQVSFGYHADKNILRGVNLSIPAGCMTALVGPSGSGKSTIAKLIAGFWDVEEGAVMIDGVDEKKIPLKQLYDQIAFVSQDNYLFDTSVRENIRMGNLSASDKEVEQAAKVAGCDAFIRLLEKGYETNVGGGGAHLSGGERQRILIFEWRVGLVVATGIFVYFLILSSMEKKSSEIAPHAQKSQTALISAVLEYVQGKGVVKSFGLSGRGDKKLQDALEYNRKSNLDMEKLMTPYTIFQELVLQIAGIAMIFVSVFCWINGTMSVANALMCIVMSFLVFGQIKLFGMGMSMLRLASASIDRTLQTEEMEQMDEKGRVLRPGSHEIEFQNVHFSYENTPTYGGREILHGIDVTLPNKTTTAVIGPSGSGKTTLVNLIARFWDVDSGSVKIGGKDVREYTLESLMEQISMVFQNVYLFADTIENNIKFGRPQATHAEVVEAARKACCADFIEALPAGYDTLIGEGGASLSGGEKQRISIARAILKDAPIVILDEATANVDPENEDRLQKAIEELTRDKTIIMIAHRLKTVRNADQILVVDDGKIVQQGKHDELITQKGIYADFVLGRKEAIGWKL